MTADLAFAPSATNCGRCSATADDCYVLRDDCCSGCTHYPEPVDDDVDEIAVERAIKGDTSVALNRQEYAEAHRILHAEGKSASQIAALLGTTARSVDRWNNGHTSPISRRPGGRAVDTTDELLIKAVRNPSKRVQAAARRAQDAVQRVRDLLVEDESKREARERVERLERELREAKAALRGKASATPTTPTVRAQTAPVDGGIACPHGCGKVSINAAGAASHARFCTVAKAS